MQEQLLSEARRIGDWLLENAKSDESGLYWETMELDLERNISFKISEGIYCGTAGIILFLMELYKHTNDERYREAVLRGTAWTTVYCEKNPPAYTSFITGRLGFSYLLMQLHRAREFFGDQNWMDKALNITRACKPILSSPIKVDDLIGGNCGMALCLLHLYNESREEWLLELLDLLIGHLLHSASLGTKGIYWDRSGNSTTGLCGYSHGAAGFGFLFLELGHFFKNESFYKLAELAFLYERNHFSEKYGNWPDFRKGMYNDEEKEKCTTAYKNNDMEFFTSTGDMNAWCHGAAGIGLSRLRAYQLLKRDLYKDEAMIAIKRTIKGDIDSQNQTPGFILCHGLGGNADIFLYAAEVLKDNSYLEYAQTVAKRGIEFYSQRGFYFSGYRVENNIKEDTSLYMGNAGIGYFYLRTADPMNIPSILVTPVHSTIREGETFSQYPNISISLEEAAKKLLQKDFPRSILLASKWIPGPYEAFLKMEPLSIDKPSPLVELFIQFIEQVLPTMSGNARAQLSEVFQLEVEKRRMDEAVFSNVYLAARDIVIADRNTVILEDNKDNALFLGLTLQLEPSIHLDITQWNWSLSSPGLWEENIERELPEEEEGLYLMRPTPEGIMESDLSPFSYTILAEFQDPCRVQDVIQSTIDAFETLEPEQEAMLREKALQQIRILLTAGILVQPGL